jgi:multiple sugar transport system substrate-binding protein
MTHSRTTRRLALLATGALVGTAFTVTPVAAQGDPNVCDGVIDGGPYTLEMTIHSGTNPGAEKETVDAFNAGPGAELGVTVELIDIGEEAYETVFNSAAAAGEAPDLVDMDGPFLNFYAWSGIVRPITSCVTEEKLEKFLPSIIEQGTYQGELYSLGSFESGMGLWAHKSMLEDVGARIPTSIDDAWTLEEFEQILNDLKDAGYGENGPLDIQWFYAAGEFRPYGFAPAIQSAGGDLIDRSTMATADGAYNSEGSAKALQAFQDWAQAGLIDLVAQSEASFTVGPDTEPNTGDETPISWVGHWNYVPYSEALGDDLILLPLPDFGNGSKGGHGSWNWAVSTGPDAIPNTGDEVDIDAAWAFIDFATEDDAIKRFVDAFGAVPPTKDLSAFPDFQPGGNRNIYIQYLEGAHSDPSLQQAGAVTRPSTPAYGFIRDRFVSDFADIIEAGAPVQETLDESVRLIDQEIEDAGY